MRPALAVALAALLAGAVAPARAQVPPSGQAVAAGLEAAREDLRRCWERAAADDFRVEGDIVLRLTFAKGGKVKKVQVRSDGPGDAVLTGCVVKLAKKWVWGDALGAGLVVDLPLSFVAPRAQYTVRAEDAPARKPRGKKLEARILIDRESAGAEKASLSILSLKAKGKLPWHRHTSAELVYVLSGELEVKAAGEARGPKAQAGDAVFVPAGAAHELVAAKATKLLVLFAPGGPERAWKDPAASGDGTTTALSRAQLAEIAPDAPKPLVVKAADRAELPILGGAAAVKILFDAGAANGDRAAYVGRLRADSGAEVKEHVHAAEAEVLYVTAGSADMTVEGEPVVVTAGMAVHIPPGAKHSMKVTSKEPLDAAQFYAPSGPEQRFKGTTR